MIFDKAEAGKLVIAFSLWNIGEALGVLDERLRREWLTREELVQILKNLADELLKLTRLRVLEAIPKLTPILTETWELILNYHIYEADALKLLVDYARAETPILTFFFDKRITCYAYHWEFLSFINIYTNLKASNMLIAVSTTLVPYAHKNCVN